MKENTVTAVVWASKALASDERSSRRGGLRISWRIRRCHETGEGVKTVIAAVRRVLGMQRGQLPGRYVPHLYYW
jgi:hypothetical protein